MQLTNNTELMAARTDYMDVWTKLDIEGTNVVIGDEFAAYSETPKLGEFKAPKDNPWEEPTTFYREHLAVNYRGICQRTAYRDWAIQFFNETLAHCSKHYLLRCGFTEAQLEEAQMPLGEQIELEYNLVVA